jgi:transcriptional regulator with XRE-family HTH domain
MEVEILGSELRAARLQKELSLDEVEQELRIRAKFLGAIEAGDYSLLPSQVQARGFLRNYAQFLGLDASTTLARYEQAMGQLDTATKPNGQLPQPTPVAISKPEDTVYPAPGTITRGPNGAGVYGPEPMHTTQRRRRAFSSSMFVLGVGAVLLFFALAWGGTQFVEALISADRKEEGTMDEFIAGVLGDQPTVTPSATLEPTPEATVGAQIIPVEQLGDGVHVFLNVVQRTWVRLTVDGAVQFEGVATPGDRLQYQATELVHIRAGNGAGLEAVINGQSVGALGARGELVDMDVTRDYQP